MIYYFIIAAVIIFDRAIKYIVSSKLMIGETVPVIENIFHITYVQNRGAAFSLMEGEGLFLIGLPAAVITAALIALFLKRKKWSRLLNLSVAFICAGGLGNLIDRVSQGYVVDMFDFRVFPVFNIADIFICAGCGLLLIEVLFAERKREKNGTR
ncbi:MAG: signal peptidase II [Anaerovoracaceae bacterium]